MLLITQLHYLGLLAIRNFKLHKWLHMEFVCYQNELQHDQTTVPMQVSQPKLTREHLYQPFHFPHVVNQKT